ncbi:MAG: hypothetical protein LBR16_00390 [Treponema sp.]|nr:hypothetical protein [Treponema sp.]
MPNGEFIVPGNTKVSCEFPCPKCGKTVHGGPWKIPGNGSSDEQVGCPCGEGFDVTIQADAGTGTVTVSGVDPKPVNAVGTP